MSLELAVLRDSTLRQTLRKSQPGRPRSPLAHRGSFVQYADEDEDPAAAT